MAAFGVAGLVGLGLSLAVDPRLLLVGAASIAAGWLYTGGPRPYGYLGLGEVFVFVFFGLVAACGTVYVSEGRVPTLGWLGGVAMGCLASAILVLNNIRDVETDAEAGKRTLAVRIGRPASRAMLAALFFVALAIGVAPALSGLAGRLSFLPALAALLAPAPLRASGERGGPALIAGLRGAARMQLVYALLWALGMLLP
jgi:1,4-dihydroxy-2-naphthoate octaprenyltransferase